MAKNTHVIVKGFAFQEDGKDNIQYKKGSEVVLSGKALEFAAQNGCAKSLTEK